MKSFFQKVIKYIRYPRKIIIWLNEHGFARLFRDKFYLKHLYKDRMGKELNLQNPQTFNEKLQWLKLYDHKPEYTTMVDKYAVKQYVADKIGQKYVISTLGVWDKFENIDFQALPDQFVLKCTHDSGGLVICRDKSKLDLKKVKRKINRSLKRNYFWHGREWPYKNVPRRIIAEKYMENDNQSFESAPQKSLTVYKVMTFSGVPRIIQTIQNDKLKDESIDYFDTGWNLLDLRQNFPNSQNHLGRPKTLNEMLDLASKMSAGFPFLRVDFYEVNGETYFSEFTFYSDGGMARFEPNEWDYKLGEWIKLPKHNA